LLLPESVCSLTSTGSARTCSPSPTARISSAAVIRRIAAVEDVEHTGTVQA
jgi:hypothetical protein